MTSKGGQPGAQKLIDQIVASSQHLLTIDASNVDELLEQMRVVAMRGGTSIYVWEPDVGLSSLRERGLHVPGSKRITDALRYVTQSLHFGVYLFRDFAEHLKPVDTLLLRRISRMTPESERKLVLVGHGVELPEELDGMFENISAGGGNQPQPRLRDGRWVV